MNDANDDKAYGNAVALFLPSLTEAEKAVVGSALDVTEGSRDGKHLIGYHSKRHRCLFKFVLTGSSSLDKTAQDFYCLGCWIKQKSEYPFFVSFDCSKHYQASCTHVALF